jgi:hypothetical protein
VGVRMSRLQEEVTGTLIILGEHETTGPLPIGFEFERSGARYDHFDVSTEGYVSFSRGARHREMSGMVLLAEDRVRLGGARVTYEVSGTAPRRRLMVSIAETAPLGTTHVVGVHERTGIVEVSHSDQSFGDPTIRQLAIFQSSPSRANSARKIG